MELVTLDMLKRLVDPFLDHDGALYFTRFANRLYVGKTPAQEYAGSTETPTNYSLLPSQVDDATLAEMADLLNTLETNRGKK